MAKKRKQNKSLANHPIVLMTVFLASLKMRDFQKAAIYRQKLQALGIIVDTAKLEGFHE